MARSLASSDTSGFVDKSRLAFALGDELAYPANAAEADDLFARNTAIIQHLERCDDAFARLVLEMESATQRRVSVSAYVADVESRAFSRHVDKWDNVIVQLQGRKRFVLDDEAHDLSPGDALFLPEDVAHRTETLERSIHLSIACLP